MTTRFLLALLGATALVPTAAMAQAEPEGRGPRMRERIERMNGEAPNARAEFDAGVRVQAPTPRPERVERPRGGEAGERWQGRPDRGDRGNWQRPDQPRPDRGEWRERPDMPRPDVNQRRDPPRDAQGQIDREQLRREWQAGRFRRDGDDRADRQRREWQRDEWRRQDDRNRGDWGQRNWGQHDWNRRDGDWRDGDRYRRDWNDRQQWNNRGQWDRGWRSDRRYDWNRYRDSNRNLYRLPRYYAPQGWGYGYRRFGIGVTLNSFLFGQNYWINDPFYYRLPNAYGAYRWVRYYNDALLVDIRTGRVVDVEYDIFW